MSEEANVEPISQFANVTYSVLLAVNYRDEPANTDYEDYNFSTFKDANLNITFTSNTMNVSKEIIPVNIANVGDPAEFADFFQFTFTGSFGEEIALQDEYVIGIGGVTQTVNSYYDLPDFSKTKDSYIIKYDPDTRTSVFIDHIVTSNAVPANTLSIYTQEVELNPSRHTARAQQIRLQIDLRSAQEKEERMKTIQALIDEAKNVSGV